MENGEDTCNRPAEGTSAPDCGTAEAERDGCRIYCMTVIGQIEGHYLSDQNQKSTKYEHLMPLLFSIEESSEIDGLLILLNTVGGDVEAGLAIAELIAGMRKPTVSLVLGGGHSIGVPLAVSAKRSFIVPSASMTIHPVRLSGTVIGAPQTYAYFEQMQKRILRFVATHSRISEDAYRRLMLETNAIASDMGTILTGEEAVRAGIIDGEGSLSDAIAALREMIHGDTALDKSAKL